MVRPCSLDLRERLVVAVVDRGLSYREAPEQFAVAPSTAVNWVRRDRSAALGRGDCRRLGSPPLIPAVRRSDSFVIMSDTLAGDS